MDAEVKAWLGPSCAVYADTGGHSLEEYQAGLERGELQLWRNASAALITGTTYLPNGGECVNVLVAGGDLAGVSALFDEVEETARRGGAHSVMTIGRPGWWAPLKVRGYQRTSAIFHKRLEH